MLNCRGLDFINLLFGQNVYEKVGTVVRAFLYEFSENVYPKIFIWFNLNSLKRLSQEIRLKLCMNTILCTLFCRKYLRGMFHEEELFVKPDFPWKKMYEKSTPL
jgi:hypothetical protein